MSKIQQCPDCGLLLVSPNLDTCLACGTQLETVERDTSDDYMLSLSLSFSTYICDSCNTANPYGATECSQCGEVLTSEDGELPPPGTPDPIVEERRRVLTELVEVRDQMREDLKETKLRSLTVRPVSTEEDYRQRYLELSDQFSEHTQELRELFSSIEFSKVVTTTKFRAQIEGLEKEFGKLWTVTQDILQLTPHSSWITWHDAFISSVERTFQGYLDVVDVLLAENFSQAIDLMDEINERFDEAGRVLERSRHVVFTGKKIRYDEAEDLSVAVASLAAEGLSMTDLQDLGWDYYEEVFSRDVEDLPAEFGFMLALWAIIAESFDDPNLLKERAATVVELCRRADAVNRQSFKAVTNRLEGDILHASRLVVNVGLQLVATDFSQLHTQQVFDIATHTYQRLSEGAFKSLLTILLFCEGLVTGAVPDYDEISRMGFSRKTRELRKSSLPLVAGLPDDLVMYVRHADAHCDFYPEADKVVIHERHWKTKKILRSHEYTEDEFVDLIQQLWEAVFAILVGIGCFQFELHEEYLSTNIDILFEYEKFELCKWIFAAKGIVVDSIQQADSRNGKSDLVLSATLAESIELTPQVLLVPMKPLSYFFPDAVRINIELKNTDDHVLGSFTVPTSHFHKFQGPGRAGELVIVELTYKLLTRYVDPPSLINPEDLSMEALYYGYFLKPVTVYLKGILMDCLQMVQAESEPSPAFLRTLDQEVTLLQQMLANVEPPELLQHHHALATRVILAAREFSRECRLSLRREGGIEPADLKAILQKAMPFQLELLEFLSKLERNQTHHD